MTAEPLDAAYWERVRTLFHAAVDAPREERSALFTDCDPNLRAEVERLLEQHDAAAGFLEQSVWDLVDSADAKWEHVLIGPYRVVRQLGHGGMGTVFLAAREDDEFEQRVAIKLVRRGAGGESILQRFRQERQILAALDHPNIARLLDGGSTTAGVPYLVMEYVEGTPIDDYCREHNLPIDERLRLFLQLCDAVQYAHRGLVIHRDIKPANVLVTADGIPKLLDFGIAKLTSAQTDATITRLMTPDYASPEQLAGKLVTTATDVYSLGLLLFELLTGKRPFEGVQRTGETEPPRASSVSGLRALRGDLDRILLVALDPDPDRRYASVDKLADDVRRHLDGHPVSARGASFSYRTAKFVRRNKLFVAAAAVAVIVAIVSFVAVLQQKRIAERRFEQVRSLAHAVVFDLHDAIAKLPGSTSARELLVRHALGYLDALASESARNTPLQLELAGAYERVGDVQGMPYRANLGDSKGALASYRKALDIAEEVRAKQPDDAKTLALIADLHDRTGWVEQRALRFRDALAHHEAARNIRQSLRDPLALARTWVAIGDSRYQSHHPAASVRGAYENAVQILSRVPVTPANRKDVLTEIGRVHQRLGGYFTGRLEHDPARALQHHMAAERALEERAALDPNDAVAKRNFADQLVMTATLQNSVKDGAAALAGTTRALPILRDLATADATNMEAQHDLSFAYTQIARAYIQLERWPEAAEAVEAALAIHTRLIERDPTNREYRRDMAGLYGMMRDVYRTRGDIANAEKYAALNRAARAK
ncbi:MAG: eukaryotic-like serine/threonine-protein kinase [Thermoanaerobaculia bacterium]|jgi:non-specific serine/threonine protein kinase/serine/threonine-protein kinase|nr:eukaryotic-like serine/threonine-protein kinase [Thermoanaerobaculia bacterium]